MTCLLLTVAGWVRHRFCLDDAEQRLARLELLKAIELDPSDGHSWYLLGRFYASEKKYSKAFEAYQQAIHRNTTHTGYLCSLGVLYFQTNQPKDALHAYLHAIRIDPNKSEVWFNLGVLYAETGSPTDALQAFTKALELDPMNPQIHQKIRKLKELTSGSSTGPTL